MRKIYTIDLSKLDMPFELFEAHYCTEDKEGYMIPSQEAIDKYNIEYIETELIDAPILYIKNKL
tara:strand:+ start:1383 stop:1574 length:192 start_codon:yes stop_codon:yes gene_type:complete